MERKDWRTKIGSILNNNRVDILDKDGSELLNDLEELFNQELDKAREEVLTELQEEFSEFGVPDDVRYTKPLFYINEIIEEKLSKLKQ